MHRDLLVRVCHLQGGSPQAFLDLNLVGIEILVVEDRASLDDDVATSTPSLDP